MCGWHRHSVRCLQVSVAIEIPGASWAAFAELGADCAVHGSCPTPPQRCLGPVRRPAAEPVEDVSLLEKGLESRKKGPVAPAGGCTGVRRRGWAVVRAARAAYEEG